MTGFELQTSGIGSDRSTNWATTTAQVSYFLIIRLHEDLNLDSLVFPVSTIFMIIMGVLLLEFHVSFPSF